MTREGPVQYEIFVIAYGVVDKFIYSLRCSPLNQVRIFAVVEVPRKHFSDLIRVNS